MIAPIATIRGYLSSLAPALSALPASDPVRDALQATATHFSRRVALATVVVAIGVALEGVELIHSAVEWIKRLKHRRRDRTELADLGEVFPCGNVRGEASHTHEPKWVKVALRVGLILVVIGVVGEWIYGAKLEDAHEAINKYDLGKIAEADRKARDAAESATTAHEEADAATVASAKAKDKADTVGTKADTLDGKLAAATSQLDAVEARRAKLEESLKNFAICAAPRVIPRWTHGKEKYNDALLKFPKWKARVEYVPDDAETRRAASNIVGALRDSTWEVTPVPMPNLPDGVEIEGFEFPSSERTSMGNFWTERQARDVATVLVNFLHKNDWQANLEWMRPGDAEKKLIPSDGAWIRVGLYPPTMIVIPPALRDVADSFAQRRKEEREAEEKIDEQEISRISKMKPEEAAELKAAHERWVKETQKLEEPFTNPCKPIEPLDPAF